MNNLTYGIVAGGLLAGGLGSTGRAAAQCHPVFIAHGYSHHAGPADTVKTTERNNQLGFRTGVGVVRSGQPTTFAGFGLELTYFSPRLQLGPRLLFTAPAASSSNFGYDATAPVLHQLSAGVSLRYVLRDGPRWRLDALVEPGINRYFLADNDRRVSTGCGCGSTAALVATSSRPTVGLGLGVSYKLARQFWLSSDFRYTQLLGTAPFGEAGLQTQWQWLVAATVPSGFHRSARPTGGASQSGR